MKSNENEFSIAELLLNMVAGNDRLHIFDSNKIDEYMDSEPIVIEQTLNAPVADVWSAITNKEQMKQWYFDLAEFKPEVGFEFSFEGGKDDRIYTHLCQITEVVPLHRLAYSWRYQAFPGSSTVVFDLFPEDSRTRLRLTHTGLETFPSSNPDFAKSNFEGGWAHIIGISIVQYFEK